MKNTLWDKQIGNHFVLQKVVIVVTYRGETIR